MKFSFVILEIVTGIIKEVKMKSIVIIHIFLRSRATFPTSCTDPVKINDIFYDYNLFIERIKI